MAIQKQRKKKYEGEHFYAETVVGFQPETKDDVSTLQFYANVESAYDEKRLAIDISVYDVDDNKADLVTKMLNSIEFFEDDEEFDAYAKKSDSQKTNLALGVANKVASSNGGLAGVAMAVADEVINAVPGGKLVKGILGRFLK